MTPLRKRWIVTGSVTTAAFGLLLVLVLRGSCASPEKTPSASGEGTIVHLWKAPDGRTVVRAAAVLDQPMDRVWTTITDYKNFPERFPNVEGVSVEEEPGNVRRLAFTVPSPVGRWAIDVRMRHEETPGLRRASWENVGGDLKVNRGSWTLTSMDSGRTLVVYVLDVELAHYPDFLIRAVLRDRVESILRGLK